MALWQLLFMCWIKHFRVGFWKEDGSDIPACKGPNAGAREYSANAHDTALRSIREQLDYFGEMVRRLRMKLSWLLPLSHLGLLPLRPLWRFRTLCRTLRLKIKWLFLLWLIRATWTWRIIFTWRPCSHTVSGTCCLYPWRPTHVLRCITCNCPASLSPPKPPTKATTCQRPL